MASTFPLIPNIQMQATPQKYALKKKDTGVHAPK